MLDAVIISVITIIITWQLGGSGGSRHISWTNRPWWTLGCDSAYYIVITIITIIIILIIFATLDLDPAEEDTGWASLSQGFSKNRSAPSFASLASFALFTICMTCSFNDIIVSFSGCKITGWLVLWHKWSEIPSVYTKRCYPPSPSDLEQNLKPTHWNHTNICFQNLLQVLFLLPNLTKSLDAFAWVPGLTAWQGQHALKAHIWAILL